MKRFFQSPQPLAFFGFLLTFLLTVAWRVPLQGSHFFGVAQAASPPPAAEPAPAELTAPPPPIPQLLPLPPAPMAIMATGATALPAFVQAAPPAEVADVTSLPNAAPNAKKKTRHPRKVKLASPAEAGDDGLAGLMNAATEGKAPRKRARRD